MLWSLLYFAIATKTHAHLFYSTSSFAPDNDFDFCNRNQNFPDFPDLIKAKMNIFRLAGDMTHLASVLVLLLKIHTIKSCAGIYFFYSQRYLSLIRYIFYSILKLLMLGSNKKWD